MIDLILVAILAGVTWFVSSEGAWSAGVTFLSVLIAGLLAMNFFEPVALLLGNAVPAYDTKMDMVALLGLFAGGVFLFRLAGERMAPTYVQVHALVEQGGRWLFGLGAGYLSMAIILTALHTAPIPREFLGFKAERGNLFGMAPDRQWLGFTQYVTEHAFGRYDLGLMLGAPPGTPHAFDAPYHQIATGANPYPNTIWPSFPIRYAMRRELYGGSAATTTPGTAPVGGAPVVPTGGAPAPRPAGGGGGGGGGPAF
jgi:hypothetical protein